MVSLFPGPVSPPSSITKSVSAESFQLIMPQDSKSLSAAPQNMAKTNSKSQGFLIVQGTNPCSSCIISDSGN
uniref:Uncharacterized protein n=1 Tax=Anguilla anguilla TaxID=7936 RepID=A0A0E9QVJ1_ANGAN